MRFVTPAAILFDLDDTIIGCEGGDYIQFWRSSIERFISEFEGLDAGALLDEIEAVADEFWSDPDRHRSGRLQIRKARQEIVIHAAENLNSPNARAATLLANHFHELREGGTVPFEGAIETLQHIRDRRIPTALLTNGASNMQRRKINQHDLEGFFDLVLIEGEFGAGKPDQKVYQHALRELDVVAAETWMIGDNLEWEVRAPQQLGIVGIWHDHLRQGLPKGSEVRPDRIVQRISELVPLL